MSAVEVFDKQLVLDKLNSRECWFWADFHFSDYGVYQDLAFCAGRVEDQGFS